MLTDEYIINPYHNRIPNPKHFKLKTSTIPPKQQRHTSTDHISQSNFTFNADSPNSLKYSHHHHPSHKSKSRESSVNKGIQLLEKVEENLLIIKRDLEKMNTISDKTSYNTIAYESNVASSLNIFNTIEPRKDKEKLKVKRKEKENLLGEYQESAKPIWLKKNYSMTSLHTRQSMNSVNTNAIGNGGHLRDSTPPYLMK